MFILAQITLAIRKRKLYNFCMAMYSLRKAAQDMGVDLVTARSRTVKFAPRALWFVRKGDKGIIMLRNRPAFFAWWYGFGFGSEAVEAFRKWDQAGELANEPEPPTGNVFMKADALVRLQKRREAACRRK